MFQGINIKLKTLAPLAIFLICIIVLMAFALRLFNNPYMSQRVADISDNWLYHTDADPAPKSIRLPSGTKGIYLNERWYLTHTLEDMGPNAAIMFRSDYLRVIAELDGEEIYRHGYGDLAVASPGKTLILIPLPEDYAGREMTLVLTPTMNLRVYSIYIGEEVSLISAAVATMLPALVLGIAVVLLGFALLSLYFIQRVRQNGKAALSDLWFGIFVVLAGVFIPSKSFLLLMLLDPITASVMPMLVSFLLPCSILLFVRASCQKFRISLIIALAVHTAGFLPLSLMQLLSPNPPTELLALFTYLIPAYYALAVLALLREVHAGKKEYRRLLVFALIIIALMITDKINSVLGNPLHFKDVEQLTKFGLIFFIIIEVAGRIRTSVRANAQMLADYQAAEVKSRLALEHFNDVKQYMEEVYRLNHDINHHFGALKLLTDRGDLGRVHDYLTQLNGDYPPSKQAVYTKNQLLNHIIGYAVKEADIKNIRLAQAINLPENIGMNDSDLYSLFINIIENAIEACALIEDSKKRRMELTCNMKNGFLYILCKNSKDNAVTIRDGKYISTKSPEPTHGLGISIIKRIVDKYNGALDIEHDPDWFTIKLVLKVA